MHRMSLEINERLARLEGMATNYGNLGDVLQTRGDLDGAEEMYRKALSLAQQVGASPLVEHITSLMEKLEVMRPEVEEETD